MNTSRKSSGNMMVLVSLSIGLVIAVGVGGFIFNSLLFQRTRAQYKVDALAMSLAGTINKNDRVGRINELEEASRELVFISRQHLEDAERQDLGFIAPLCDELLVEARANQSIVESERRNQIGLITREIQDEARKFNQAEAPAGNFSLRWLQTEEPRITRVDVGRISNIQSNVRTLDAIPELSAFDRKQGNIEDASRLYKANINAKLPGSDSDLDYKLASLPAYVEKTCAPARNANPDVFLPSGTIMNNGISTPSFVDFIPNAVRVYCSMKASVGSERKQTSLDMNSTGITSGALSE
jgi:hypothetical protein